MGKAWANDRGRWLTELIFFSKSKFGEYDVHTGVPNIKAGMYTTVW